MKKDENIRKENLREIYLAGGCFWGVEAYFKKLPGSVYTEVGYANGKIKDTDYNKLKETDHAETLRLVYDISKISLEEILLHYFRIIDPKSVNKQGPDEGRQYRSGIFTIDEESKKIVAKLMTYERKKLGELAVVSEDLRNFVKAEAYHQNYLDKNIFGYCHIDLSLVQKPIIGEDFEILTKSQAEKELDKKSLEVIYNAATERPGESPLNNENRRGIYVDKLSGKPLFISDNKFDAGCGWPSFTKPITTDAILEKEDKSHAMLRTEVLSKDSKAHLGHVFSDGPINKGGLRYCINGASLKFIPYEEMKGKYEVYKIFLT